jgi:DNA-binding transcriptional LysR family regulator
MKSGFHFEFLTSPEIVDMVLEMHHLPPSAPHGNDAYIVSADRLRMKELAQQRRPPDRKSMPPFEALRVFDAVARLGGIRRAAQFLERNHAVVSRHLRSLETWLGVRLVERGASGIVLTETGKSYHQRIGQALDHIGQATTDLVSNGYHNRLHIWSTPGFALYWFSSHLGAFERMHSALEIELRPTDTSPDFSSHEADVDIRFFARYDERPDVSNLLRSTTIAVAPIIAVASASYLDKAAVIEKPSDLLKHTLLHESSPLNWVQWLQACGVDAQGDLQGPKLWQGHLTLDAARRGRGITLINGLVARDDLVSGQLVQVGKGNKAFPDVPGDYVMTARADRWADTAMRKFRQWLSQSIVRELPEFKPGR